MADQIELQQIIDRAKGLDRQAIDGLDEAWGNLQTILESQRKLLESTSVQLQDSWELGAYRAARRELSERLFIEPTAQWERRRPYKRALSVVEAYETGLTDLIRSAPERTSVEGPIDDVLAKNNVTGWRLRLARLRRDREIPMRLLVQRAVQLRIEEWSRMESEFFLAMAQSLRLLRVSWDIRRMELDSRVEGTGNNVPEIEVLRKELETADALRRKGEDAIVSMREWSGGASFLVTGVLASVLPARRRDLSKAEERRNDQRNHLTRQLQSVEAELRLDQALLSLEVRSLELAAQTLASLNEERLALQQELDETIKWCSAGTGGLLPGPLPPPKAGFVPVSSRLRDFEESFRTELGKLPETVEVLSALSERSPRRARWQRLTPRSSFSAVYERRGRPGLSKTLEDVDTEHRRIVREIERAREVVAFGQETAGEDQDSKIEGEAIRNALSLLLFAREHSRNWMPLVSSGACRALAGVFEENRLLLRRRRLGAILYVWRQGLRHAPGIIWNSGVSGSARALRSSYEAIASAADWALTAIGWKAKFGTTEPEVTTRPFMPAEFTVDLNTKELPAIYRRLFRFAPVEDPRFLIGREDEIRALSGARTLWEEGRPVSVIIVGRRGSGKTSLINCAIKRSLEGLEVIRGEIHRRVVTEEELRILVAELAGVADPARLEEFLTQKRRVFVLEEVERIFLRQVGNYEAIRGLQRLIAATSSSTLWVTATNEIAFRFLDASSGLGQSFSHRINAGAVSHDNLRQAILLRHNLSGLRLEFAPPPRLTDLVSRAKRRLKGEADAETIFFDVLARESTGVIRAAFEIWLGQIDRAASGALYLKPLLDLDLSPVVNDLDLKDLFTLVAVLQHGSLTPAEHAKVFQVSASASQAQLDELVSREIIEPDPGRAGLRVRPEAVRVVHEALYRRNLV